MGDERRGAFGRLYLRLGDRLGGALEREVIAAPTLAPERTPARIAAGVVAVVVYAATLALFAAGVLLLVGYAPSPVATLAGLALIGVAFVVRPRPYGDGGVVSSPAEDRMPALTAAIAEVARALDVAPPDAVVIDTKFNASWSVEGWRRRRVLRLGLPLIVALDGQELLALIAHELGHDRNGDARRGLLVGSTVNSLSRAMSLLDHRQRETSTSMMVGMAAPLVAALLWVLSRPVYGLLNLQAHLLFRQSQRAEYLADDLAASVAGTPAALGLEDALLVGPAVYGVIRRAVLTGERGDELFEDIRRCVTSVEPEQRDVLRARARETRMRLDDTHPPAASRIAVLEGRPQRDATVTLDAAARSAIAAELARLRRTVGEELLDEARGRMYTG